MKNKDTASPTLGDLRQELYQTTKPCATPMISSITSPPRSW